MLRKLKKIGSAVLCISMAFCTMPQAFGSSIPSVATTETELPEKQEGTIDTADDLNEEKAEITDTSDIKEESDNSLGGGAEP